MEMENATQTTQEVQTSTTSDGHGSSENNSSGGEVQGATAAGAGNDGAISQGAGATAKTESVTDAYIPNFKFKVKDKELEFDDYIRPIVKNKELEAKVREMYEKAHGIDEVKAARESFKNQTEEWKNKYNQVEQSLQTLGTFVKKGDFRTFFQALNIPKEQIIKYAIDELKYQELPPEQRQAIDTQREQENTYAQVMQQNQAMQQQMQQLILQQTTYEINRELTSPGVAEAVQAYDARVGKPGSFLAEVIRRGQYYEATQNKSLPASELVKEILTLIGVQAQSPQGSQATSQAIPGQVSAAQVQAAKPTLPTFASGAGAKSPTRKVPNSLEDLRAMRQNLTT